MSAEVYHGPMLSGQLDTSQPDGWFTIIISVALILLAGIDEFEIFPIRSCVYSRANDADRLVCKKKEREGEILLLLPVLSDLDGKNDGLYLYLLLYR